MSGNQENTHTVPDGDKSVHDAAAILSGGKVDEFFKHVQSNSDYAQSVNAYNEMKQAEEMSKANPKDKNLADYLKLQQGVMERFLSEENNQINMQLKLDKLAEKMPFLAPFLKPLAGLFQMLRPAHGADEQMAQQVDEAYDKLSEDQKAALGPHTDLKEVSQEIDNTYKAPETSFGSFANMFTGPK